MHRIVAVALVTGAVAAVVLSAQSGAPPPPPQEGIPGRATQARVYVLNRDKTEAIPVTLLNAETLKVAVTGTPTVQIDPATTPAVKATAARQAWDYRTLTGETSSAAFARDLNAAGADGWELAGTVPAPGGAALLIFKRPR